MSIQVEHKAKWLRFYGPLVDPLEVGKYCRECLEESRRKGKPSEKAMNCWKIIARFEEDRWNDVWSWIKEIVEKYPRLTGELTRNVLIIYFQSGRQEMWRFREKMINDWCERRLLPFKGSYFIPYRRGGAYYDSRFGPWRTWRAEYYDLTGELKEKAEKINAICPYDGAVLEKKGNKLECPLCGFKIPLNVVYEVLEYGLAEYELKSGPRAMKIYRVKLISNNRIEVIEYNPCSTST